MERKPSHETPSITPLNPTELPIQLPIWAPKHSRQTPNRKTNTAQSAAGSGHRPSRPAGPALGAGKRPLVDTVAGPDRPAGPDGERHAMA